MDIVLLAVVCAIATVLYGIYLSRAIMRADAGHEKMIEIAAAIQEGAGAYLNRQYRTIAIVGVIIAVILTLLLSWASGLAFVIGAVFSGLAGYIGMLISVRANVRTAQAASHSLSRGLRLSFDAGAVTGLLVAGLALLAIAGSYWLFTVLGASGRALIEPLVALSFGASLISIFARLGGGIFTKGADVGADLVGKVEAGIPEDDPRNPAVIADNVGDNVGDCAGMAADLFETYVVTVVATIVIASILFTGATAAATTTYPIALGAIGVLASIVGSRFVRLGKSEDILGALTRGFIATAILGIIGMGAVTYYYDQNSTGTSGIWWPLFGCAIIGIVLTGLIVKITEYYTTTSARPVRSIAQASTTGHGTNVIQGLAISMEATAIPAVLICIGIYLAYALMGLYGLAIAVTSMLSLAGMIVALDAYGPVTDNAGGIAEMSGMDESVRTITDKLDAVGNTTKAVTKGYAIGSAGLGTLVLFAAYTSDLNYFIDHGALYPFFDGLVLDFSLANPFVIIGLFAGGMLPYLFGALGMTAVGRAAGDVVEEVRRQFAADPGIMAGTSKPDYARTVDLLTRAAIREMTIPSLLPLLSPLVLFGVVWAVADRSQALAALGAMLIGVIVTGLFVAISMTAGGGAWDNAKKLIEDGEFGGKGSAAHQAAVTGDTVGDPYKDTVGPAINPMIKITNIVALSLLMALAH
ncbi:MAG: sodium-translocating pyrophosphatase [Pseudomonadota bacterium]